MGGRGASRLGPRNSRSNFSKGGLGPNVPATLKDAIGAKGKPLSITDSFEGANPNYSAEHSEYSENCQRCVVAYELRRRGYDVEALPTYDGDTKPYVAHSADSGQVYARWMGAFQNASPKHIGANTSDEASANLRKRMRGFGNGSRGVVQVFWKQGGGHVFNVENVGGRIKAYDAQTGKSVKLTEYMNEAKPGSVNLIRTDNLRMSDRAKAFVSKKK